MKPVRAFLLSFALGLVALAGGQQAYASLTQPEPVPALKGPLHIPVA
jgi:hypothetical protein